MKDDRFIELVNLYIDRQITGEETSALEAEIQANPRRRAVYRQYCQMHRATTIVYESFRTDPTDQPIVATGPKGKIARFEPEQDRRRTHWAYYASGLAAACVALVFARLNSSQETAQSVAHAAVPTKQTIAVAAIQSPVVVAPVAALSPAANPVTVQSNALVNEHDYAAMLAAMRKEDQRAFAKGQIQPSRTSSLFEDGIFDTQQVSVSAGSPKKPTSTQQAEFAAFQFQR